VGVGGVPNGHHPHPDAAHARKEQS
jgi:hypothetical protein